MLVHPLAERLRALGLSAMADTFLQMQLDPAATDLSRKDWLGLLLEREVTARDNKRLGRRLTQARLRQNAVVEDTDFRAQRGLDRALSTCSPAVIERSPAPRRSPVQRRRAPGPLPRSPSSSTARPDHRYRRPSDRRTRPQRWREAAAELLTLQADYSAWSDALPDALRDSPTAMALEAIVDLDFDLEPLAATDPPRGYGRD